MQKTKTTMADGMLALSWNNHATTFCHMLSHIRLKDKYADATVACEGKFYPVHRIVLSTCSKYFEEMFELTSAGKHPIVLLQDVRKYELESILSYMYAGVVSVAQKDLARLIKVAELLQIKGLAVPDELPSDRRGGNQNSANVSERTTKTSHALEHSDDKASPYRKRRRRDEVPPQAPGPSFNKDEDEIQEIKQSDYLSKDFEDSNKEDENRRLGLDRTENAMLSLEGRTSESEQSQQQTSLDAVRKASKDPKDDLLWIKEEVVDDPAENAGNAVKTELSFESMGEAGDESVDRAFNDQEDYSQPSHSQMPTDAAAEALAGPSGIHEWLSGGDLAAMENYGGEGSPPTSDHPQAQQLGDENLGSRTGDLDEGGLTLESFESNNVTFYKCPFCMYSHFRKLYIERHIRTHTGEKPYGCPYCPAKFSQRGSLNYHIRLHTGEKPFSCNFCQERFFRKSYLKQHMAANHQQELIALAPR